jgi:hypothetical protein
MTPHMMKSASALAITPAERQRREDAINYARASVALEGFVVPEAYRRATEAFIRGDIDFETLGEKAHDIARDIVTSDYKK